MASDIKTGNPSLDDKISEWLRWDKNENSIAVIKDLIAKKDIDTLEDLLLNRQSFGTAGIRGIMRPGYASMNDLVIIQTSQGLAVYLETIEPEVKKRGVVIGFDARHNSHRFAKLAAVAFIQKDIPAHLYSMITPTPFVSFGVIQMGCIAGIMVTASHNPKEYNGYKVYWSNGAQIIPPHDKGIQECILKNLEPWKSAWDVSLTENNKLCVDPLAAMEEQFYDVMSKNIFDKEMNTNCPITFTFTAMHGVSHRYMEKAFEVCGFQQYVPVKEQMKPDPDFPTVKFPNPEEGETALHLSIETADANNSRVILANDPDADRLGLAEKLRDGDWKIFTGNETGALLGWWLWTCYVSKNPNANPNDVYMLSSTVSSKILKSIANKEGFNFIETLTGFKWMGNKAYELMQQKKTVLFAFEEAIGFMCGTTVLDKDGISAAMHLAQLTAKVYSHGLTLFQQLKIIYGKYGYHVCNNSYFICQSKPVITSIFIRLRNFDDSGKYPERLDSYKIKDIRDLTTGYDSTQPDKKAVLPVSSSSEMITFYFENGCIATLRTSGTEPKIKYYSELCIEEDESKWLSTRNELKDIVFLIIKKWLEPEKNGLIPKD